MRVVTVTERVDDGVSPVRVPVKRIGDVTDSVIADSFRNMLPLDVLDRLLRLKLVQAGSYPGSIGAEYDREGRPWQLVPHAGYEDDWKPLPDGRTNVLPASIVARLMLRLDCVMIDDRAARIDDTDENQLAVYHLYVLGPDGEVGRERTDLRLGLLELYGLLRLMASVEGVVKLRRAVRIDGRSYEQDVDGRIIETRMGKDDLPLADIATPRVRRAEAILAPLIGQRAFDLLCVAFLHCLVATPRGFFLLSGDGYAIRTLLHAYIRSFRAIATDDVSLRRLKGGEGWATRTREIRKLIGKPITFMDGSERINGASVECINHISRGMAWSARSGEGEVRSWVFIATNKPVTPSAGEAMEGRMVPIRLGKSSKDEWEQKVDDGTGRLVKARAYASSPACIHDMVSRGLDLVMGAQAEAGTGVDMLHELSMNDATNAANPVEPDTDAGMVLARLILDDARARTGIESGTGDGCVTGIPAATATGILGGADNARTLLDKLEIDTRNHRIRKGGKRPYVLYLRNPRNKHLLELCDHARQDAKHDH
ncbi:hypothetical protein [Bifidobacterium tissieri]|nr:hypothetical protein [Bifidobacterium tissieri]